MAAVVAPLAAPGAPTPTIVTISGTVPGNNLAITFHATDPFVINYRTLPFVFSAAAPGGGPQTASVPMGMAIRTWGVRLTLNDPGTRIHASTVSGFTVAFTGAAFSRFLTELAASGLLNAGPFECQRDSDAALLALTIVNPAHLAIQINDFLALEPFDRPAIAAVAAVPGRGRGRGRGRGAAAAVPAQAAVPAVPGPPNLAFLDICSMDAFAEAQTGPCPLMTFVRLVGALGPVATHASRLDPRSAAQSISHAIRSSAALSSGVDAATAAPPTGNAIIFSAVPQTVDSAYNSLTAFLALDKVSYPGLAMELRDALVFARGDQAQCDQITIRRLSLIGDRCAFRPLPPPLSYLDPS